MTLLRPRVDHALALLLVACSSTEDGGGDRFVDVDYHMYGPSVFRDRADSRCHAVYKTSSGVAYIGTVPCGVP